MTRLQGFRCFVGFRRTLGGKLEQGEAGQGQNFSPRIQEGGDKDRYNNKTNILSASLLLFFTRKGHILPISLFIQTLLILYLFCWHLYLCLD